MRVLVDASFPESVAGPHQTHEVDRYHGDPVSDPELVLHASQHDYDVLVFLGTSALAEDQVIRAARHARLTVAATFQTAPEAAGQLIIDKLDQIADQLFHTAVVVKTRGVEALDPGSTNA